MKLIGTASNGNIIVEMIPEAWDHLQETVSESVVALAPNQDIGQTIMEFRKRNMLSQTDFAERAVISRNYLSMIENGRANIRHGHIPEDS